MKQLHISGLPQWQVTVIQYGKTTTQQIGANCQQSLRRSLTSTADRVSIVAVMVHRDWSDK